MERRHAVALRLLLAALILAPCPSDLVAQDGTVRVEVRGVEEALRQNVMATLSLAAGGGRLVMAPARVRRLHDRASSEIALALEAFGHYEPQVEDSLVFDGRRWVATYTIDPGPVVRVTRMDIVVESPGGADPQFQQALQRFPWAVGDPLYHARYEATKLALEGVAAERGYLDAAFDSSVIRVDRAQRTAEVTLHFKTGPRFAFGTVTFLQDVLDPDFLSQLVPFQPGSPFDAAQLLSLQNALSEGPYFSGVEIVPRRDLAEDLVVPIEVHLVPQPAQRLLTGLGYGTDTGPRWTGGVEIRRLNKKGHTADAEARVSFIERRISTRYSLPLRGANASLVTLSAGFVDANPTTSDTKTFLLGASLARIWGGWRHDASLTLQRASYKVGPDSGVSTLLVLGTGLSRVRADDRIFPTRGSLLSARVRGSHDALLSDNRLLQISAEVRLVRSLGEGTRVLARAEVGVVHSSDFRSLPAPFRYLAGGDRSVRGYGYQSLGPVDGAGKVVGGERLLIGSLELDHRVFGEWGVAAFFDTGNALTSFSDALERGTGAGIRWRSPIGMIRLDGAFAISRENSPFRLHLSLGPEL